ncbi:MAG: hypothetical protein ACK5LN_04005 [Propioniciclava sp.]
MMPKAIENKNDVFITDHGSIREIRRRARRTRGLGRFDPSGGTTAFASAEAADWAAACGFAVVAAPDVAAELGFAGVGDVAAGFGWVGAVDFAAVLGFLPALSVGACSAGAVPCGLVAAGGVFLEFCPFGFTETPVRGDTDASTGFGLLTLVLLRADGRVGYG